MGDEKGNHRFRIGSGAAFLCRGATWNGDAVYGKSIAG
jgi:hypothetical protein